MASKPFDILSIHRLLDKRRDAPDVVGIDNSAAVDSTESRGVEFLLQGFERMIAQIALRGSNDVYQLAFGLECDDLGRIEQVKIGATAPDNFSRGLRGRRSAAKLAFRLHDGSFETLAPHRLQQIIDGVDIERFSRVALIGGDEDDQRFPLLPQGPDYGEAIQFRHLQIQQDDVRFELQDSRQGFCAGGSFAGDFERRHGLDVLAQNVSRDWFIIGDQNPQPETSMARAAEPAIDAGMEKDTRDPSASE